MGACYEVTVKIRVSDEAVAVKALNEHIANDNRTNYNLERYKEFGITPDTLDGLMRILLAERQSKVSAWQEGQYRCYENGFDASYGWESVMMAWFNVLTPFLSDGSQMLIYPDSDYDELIVRNGKCVQLH